ncbi:hypothetical protein V6N13_057322 [Hibiscus sabdariffa]
MRRRLLGRIKGPGLGRHHDPRRSTPRADRRTGSRRSTSDRGASSTPIRFPPDNFKHSLTLFSKSFSSFPRSTCSLSTAPRGAIGSGHDGALTLSGAPFQGTWAWSVAEDASPDYNSDAEGDRFSSWAIPGSLVVTKGILGDTGSHVTETGRRRGAMMRPHPLPKILDNTFTGRSARQVLTMILPQDQPGSIPSRRPSRMVLNTLPRQGRGHNEARASFVSSTIEHRCTDVVESCRSTHSGHRARLRSTKQPQGHLTDTGWQYIRNSIDLGTQHRIPIAPLGLDGHKGRTLKSSAARQFDA